MSIKNEGLAALATARDEARLHAHLLSMDARDRFRTLEAELDSLERSLLQMGERATETATKSARELATTVTEFLKEHAPSAAALNQPAATVMTRVVSTCSPADSLNRAAQIMWESNCGALPVVNQEGIIVAMITDRDICMASYTQGRDLSALTVEHAMSKAVKACAADEPLSRVFEIMRESQVRRVPVISEGRVVGIIALADLARWVAVQRSGRVTACDALATTLSALSQAPSFERANPAQAAE